MGAGRRVKKRIRLVLGKQPPLKENRGINKKYKWVSFFSSPATTPAFRHFSLGEKYVLAYYWIILHECQLVCDVCRVPVKKEKWSAGR